MVCADKPTQARMTNDRAIADYDRALADYDQAIALDPNNAESYIWHDNKCRVYYVKRDCDRAIASCEQAIKLIQNMPSPTTGSATSILQDGTTIAP
jgi:tetratricopeptide (TPR) repeat protein